MYDTAIASAILAACGFAPFLAAAYWWTETAPERKRKARRLARRKRADAYRARRTARRA